MKKTEHFVEKIIFGSRWIQAPVYLGLILASALYTYRFAVELIHLFSVATTISEELLMLSVLTLVDISMVLNLLAMVIIGGYSTFVSHLYLDDNEDRPEWLEKISAGTLKVKLAGALIGVSGIHLLKTFINIENHNLEHIKWQAIIHVVFLGSILILAYTEKVLHYDHKAN